MKQIITAYESPNFLFGEEITDDSNNPTNLLFTSITCPLCQKVSKNVGWHNFKVEKEDFCDLLMVDNNIDDLCNIIQCKVCKKLFKIDFEGSTKSEILVNLLLTHP